ncbi:MAG: ABC transporter permease [Candidatus Moranbacteria bacterium]|nr:ABC transporter permease [Candidatus Moranbacteria bacterium]
MLFSDLLRMSLRMFKARTMRTLLTILGMGVGISAILLLVSFGYGIQRTLLQKITTSDALSTLDITRTDDASPALDRMLIEKLSVLPFVEAVIPVIEIRSQAKIAGVTLDSGSVLSSPEFLKLEGLKFAEGKGFSSSGKEAVITTGMVKAFQKEPADLIGQTATLALFIPKENADKKRREEMKVSIDTPFTIVGVVEGDENLLYAPIGSTDGVSLPAATKIKVKSQSTGTLPQLRDEVTSLSLSASSISETIDQANKVFRVVQIVLMLFGVIALVVSAIGMFNTMTITLLERTEEIGIMKSIGASPGSISLMFIMEATLMGFLGSLMGIIIGYLGGEIVNILFNLVATNFGGQKVDLFYSPLWFVGSIIAFGAFVGFLTGVIPARNAARTDALEALRYK